MQDIVSLAEATNNILRRSRPGIMSMRRQPVKFRLLAMALSTGCIARIGAGRRRCLVIRRGVLSGYLRTCDRHYTQATEQQERGSPPPTPRLTTVRS